MARYCGKIGYAETVEVSEGIFEETITERLAYGDIVKAYAKQGPSNQINQGLTLNGTFSIIADPYLNEHLGYVRYLVYSGVKWGVESITPESHCRVTLTVGGKYD